MLLRYIEQLGGELGLTEGLSPNDNGVYTLQFEPDLQISLSEKEESGITMYTQLAPVPQKEEEAFLHTALSANLFGSETGGAALGLDREGKFVTLTRQLVAGVEYYPFREALEDFINYADAWRVDVLEADAG